MRLSRRKFFIAEEDQNLSSWIEDIIEANPPWVSNPTPKEQKRSHCLSARPSVYPPFGGSREEGGRGAFKKGSSLHSRNGALLRGRK